ncbi:MAG: NifU family protein [Candidatus Pacebacteria bacterium]|nr:NifU family protein [Candidatus Paceibacterota bacterium]
MEKQIREVCDQLRAQLQADGGDMEVIDVHGTKVLVRLHGACSGCPHAAITLKNGVERILQQKVSEDITVERVD